MATIFEQAVDKVKSAGEEILAGTNTIIVDTTAAAIHKINDLLGGSGNVVDKLTTQAQDHPFVYTLIAAGSVYTYGTLAAAETAQAEKGGTIVTPAGEAVTNTTSKVVSQVNDYVKTAANAVNTFIKPITDTIDSITSTVRNINDHLIQPIIRPIQTIQQQYEGLVTALNEDIRGGLKGLVKIPQQISDALTVVDASFNRSLQQLGQINQDVATGVLAPAIFKAGTEPLTALTSTLTPRAGRERLQAAHEVAVSLTEDTPVDAIAEKIKEFEDFATKNDSWWGPLIQWTWSLLFVGDYIVKQVENAAIPWEHHVKMQNPYQQLGPGDVIEAWRRDVLNEENARDELARNGYNRERQDVLFQVAQYLFGPADAVALLDRGVINDTVFEQLMSQNNLDAGQSESLKKLIQFIYAPSDAAQLRLRGYIDQDVYLNICKANHMNEQDALSFLLLTIRPLTSSLFLTMTGRSQAKNNGFLSETFNSFPPADVVTAYERESKSDQQANLEWLAHWRVPPADWWVQAYFRGIRTRSECYEAFRAQNIPKEVWDDLFVVDENFPSVFQIPSMLGAGALTGDQGHAILKKLGFSEELANIFVKFGLTGAKTTKADTAGELQKLSLGNAKALYTDGVIDEETYTEVLVEHGYSDTAASLTVQLTNIELERSRRKDFGDFVVNEVKVGNLDIDTAIRTLYDQNFTEGEVVQYQLKMQAAKAANSKLPSESQLDKLLKAGQIGREEWLATMQLLGYSEYWAAKLLTLQ